MKISGSIIQAYLICPRQAWLLSRQITGNQYNEFMAIGRLLSEESFKRDKKEIMIGGNKIDVIRGKAGKLTIIETKKSSKMIEASKMQLINYLYQLAKKGYKVKGEIRVPKEKKIIPVEFGDIEKAQIEKLQEEIAELINQDEIPEIKRIKTCKNCSYNEFCWS
jgi:CRISPR-associated exonuclease Cas4